MGIGFFKEATGKFDLILSIQYYLDEAQFAGDLDRWRKCFQRASELLFDATDGQHQFGNIYVCRDYSGGNIADMWLMSGTDTSESGAYPGLGNRGNHIELGHDEMFLPLVVVHEFGHYVYGLYDENRFPWGAEGAVCLGGSIANACIMEAAAADGDQWDQANDRWEAGRISEFCVVLNHTTNNEQSSMNNDLSCWQTMVLTDYDLQLPMTPLPDGQPALPGEGPAPADVDEAAWPEADSISWIELVQEQRFVLVIDRSGSMAGDKLAQTKIGAKNWADEALINDRVGVVSYSDTVLPVNYPIKVIENDGDRGDVRNAIDGISAGGLTAIGDGLREGLNQIVSDGERGWQNVIALVTDGYHNTGEDPSAVVQDLKDHGVRVYPVGIGDTVNTDLLLDIADETGGEPYHVEVPTTDNLVISPALIEIEGLAHDGGLVISIPGTTNPGAPVEAIIEPGSEMAIFTLCWKNPQDLLFLELRTPHGDPITLDSAPANVRPIYTQNPYMSFQVKDPIPGKWELIVNPKQVNGKAHFHLFAFSRNPHIHGGIISPRRLCQPGIALPVQLQCYFKHPLTGLKVSGRVIVPDGESVDLEFHDDGNRDLGDARSEDGLYSTIFRETHWPGLYTIKVTVESDGSSEGGSVSYAKFGRPPDDEEEEERPDIPPFLRQFTRTVGVGEVPFRDVRAEPNSGYPGETLQVTLKGRSTHFTRGDTSANFGEGIEIGEIKVVDKHTAQVPITIAKDAQLGLRDVAVTTARYQETIEVEGGFQVVPHRCGCSVILARLWKLLRAIWQGLAFIDEVELMEVNRD